LISIYDLSFYELPLALASGEKDYKTIPWALAQSSFEASSLKEVIELFVERANPMMLLLRINILSYFWQQRFTDGNDKIFILPMKFAVAQLILVYPVRRFTLEQPHYFIQVLSGT
jgi:hypothetical protein